MKIKDVIKLMEASLQAKALKDLISGSNLHKVITDLKIEKVTAEH